MPQSIVSNQPIDNYEFYSCSQGHQILNSKNFPPDIIDFLKSEYEVIRGVLVENKKKYNALLEIGCGNARNINLASSLRMKYFGIDFIEKEVMAAKQKIEKNNLIGHVQCISVLNLDHNTTPIPEEMRTVSLFPFNVFGNIFEPMKIFKVMQKLNYDLIISTYRTDVQTDAIYQYYNTCGLSNIKTINLDIGTMFLSKEGFKSIIYDSEYLQHITEQLGLTMQYYEFSSIGKLYYIQ